MFHKLEQLHHITELIRLTSQTPPISTHHGQTRGGPPYERNIPVTVIYEHLAQREDKVDSPRYHGSYQTYGDLLVK